jgi:glycosyltransferase involved in cell wall biosynthesis
MPAHEIIVVDDGSKDNSLEIAERYMFKEFPYIESPVRVISQVNKGLSSARNTGIMNAIGDYILPLDADDIFHGDIIEKITKVIEETDADIVAPSFKCFGKAQDEVVLMDNPTLEDFKTGNRIGYFSAIRKSKLLQIGGYSPRMTWGYEDYHLWINLLSVGVKLVTLKDKLVLYRTKEHSMINVAQSHHEELMAQIKKDFPLYD